MKKIEVCALLVLLLFSCHKQKTKLINIDNLTSLKTEFLQQIPTSNAEEGPFSFNYNFRTIFFAKEVTSLFGEICVHDRLPHGWQYYEGKTFYTINNRRKEVLLSDLFKTNRQREFLRKTCEDTLKKESISYFAGKDPLYTTLPYDLINTFVINDKNLIIIFQPYTVGGGADSPFLVKVPFTDLKGHWEESHPIHALLSKAIESRNFTSSWDLEQFYEDLRKEKVSL